MALYRRIEGEKGIEATDSRITYVPESGWRWDTYKEVEEAGLFADVPKEPWDSKTRTLRNFRFPIPTERVSIFSTLESAVPWFCLALQLARRILVQSISPSDGRKKLDLQVRPRTYNFRVSGLPRRCNAPRSLWSTITLTPFPCSGLLLSPEMFCAVSSP